MSYKVYCIGGDNHVLAPAEQIEAENDAAALQAVQSLQKPTKCEVWSGSRFVGVTPAANSN